MKLNVSIYYICYKEHINERIQPNDFKILQQKCVSF